MSKINAICVYCGSSPGTDPAFVEAARAFRQNPRRKRHPAGLWRRLHRADGRARRAVIEHGGAATGIIPEFLTAKERPRRLAQEQIVTRDMHERKSTMFDRADAFVALPGGIGTLEELVEQMTWAQLGRHKKPILIANINGFWDPLLALLDAHARARAWCHRRRGALILLVADRVDDILPKLREAARAVSEAEKKMAVPAERM